MVTENSLRNQSDASRPKGGPTFWHSQSDLRNHPPIRYLLHTTGLTISNVCLNKGHQDSMVLVSILMARTWTSGKQKLESGWLARRYTLNQISIFVYFKRGSHLRWLLKIIFQPLICANWRWSRRRDGTLHRWIGFRSRSSCWSWPPSGDPSLCRYGLKFFNKINGLYSRLKLPLSMCRNIGIRVWHRVSKLRALGRKRRIIFRFRK